MEDGGNNMDGYISCYYHPYLFTFSFYDRLAFLSENISAYIDCCAVNGVLGFADNTKGTEKLVDKITVVLFDTNNKLQVLYNNKPSAVGGFVISNHLNKLLSYTNSGSSVFSSFFIRCFFIYSSKFFTISFRTGNTCRIRTYRF
jgi:hypothetical protein